MVAVALVAIASATAFVATVQETLRLVQVGHLAGTCAVRQHAGCRRLDVRATVDALLALDRRGNNLLVALYVVLVAAAVAWLLWQHGAQRLVCGRLAAPEVKFTAGWAVGWWFVPVANLVMPVIAVSELWRASGGDDGSGTRWQGRPIPARIRWWWAFVLAASVLAALTLGQADPALTEYFHVRSNAILLTGHLAAITMAGVLGLSILRSIERRLERARRYPDDVRLASWSGTEPEPGVAAPSVSAETPRRSWGAFVGTGLAVATVAAAVFVIATAPAISAIEDPASGPPSPVPTFSAPADWPAYGSATLGFVMSAPPDWHESDDGSPALLRLEPRDGRDAACLVIIDPRSARKPLPAVVDDLLSQIHDPSVYDLEGGVDVAALALPGGAAERLRFTAGRAPANRGYVQYVMVDGDGGWLIGCDAPASAVDGLEPTFERMISTFRFV